MALTQRGKIAIGMAATAVVAVLAVLAFTGNAPKAIQDIVGTVTGPRPCPLTGEVRPNGKDAPESPMLAVKIENSPEARPQSGLEDAEVVFEEPVEGGLTRFIALYHCRESARLGPIRSARLTDPEAIAPFGRSLFAYAGGAVPVTEAIGRSDLVDLSYLIAVDAYERDADRSAPHNLYSSTRALRRAARGGDGESPAEVFVFSETFEGKSKPARVAHLPFSAASDVVWSWSPRADGWLRSHGSEPHLSETGERIRADTVVVMHVKVRPGEILDAAGNPSPDVTLTGKGRAWILRDGRVIKGRWERADLSEATRFVTRNGDEIPLRPGTTWIELLPTDVKPEFGVPA